MSPPIMPVRRAPIQETRQSIRAHVRRVIAQSQASHTGQERRRNLRVPFPYPLYLTPLDASGEAVHEERFSVVGRHLSECGLDFYHTEPITSRKLIASLDGEGDQMIEFVLEVTWCRFGRHGWYENGGRFMSIVQPSFG